MSQPACEVQCRKPCEHSWIATPVGLFAKGVKRGLEGLAEVVKRHARVPFRRPGEKPADIALILAVNRAGIVFWMSLEEQEQTPVLSIEQLRPRGDRRG